MALIKSLSYTLQNLGSDSDRNDFKSISLKTTPTNPKYLLHKATVIGDARRRQGTASCKTRSEVRGGGKKPWKQKGTGQARSGSTNSPLWRGGGVSFGPKPKSYEKKINAKEKQLALSTALYHSSNKLTVINDSVGVMSKPSTREVVNTLEKITKIKKENRILLIVNENNENLNLSVRNVANVHVIISNALNLRELLLAQTVIITEKALLNITKASNI